MDIFFALNGEQIDNRKIGKTKTFLRLFFIKIVIIFIENWVLKIRQKLFFYGNILIQKFWNKNIFITKKVLKNV